MSVLGEDTSRRQPEPHLGPALRHIPGEHLAAVPQQDLLRDRQPEPGPLIPDLA